MDTHTYTLGSTPSAPLLPQGRARSRLCCGLCTATGATSTTTMATASRKDLPAALAAPAPAMTPAGHEAALRRLHRLGRHARSTAAAPAATAAPVPPPSLPRARDAEDDSVRKDDMAAGTATSRAAGASAGSAGVSAGSTVAIGGSAGGASGAALARAATAGAGGSGFDFGLFRVARDLTTIAFGDLDLESARHGGQLVARVLEAHGVKFVFTLTGGHISPILVAAEKSSGIRVIDTRHEAVAVFAADAVGRLTGTAGVAAVTAGPGTANAVCAIRNWYVSLARRNCQCCGNSGRLH